MDRRSYQDWWIYRFVTGRRRLLLSFVAGLALFSLLPDSMRLATRLILSWDLTADYVKQRKAFGKPLAAFQNTQFRLAEMRMQLDIAQCYVDQCVRAFAADQLTAADAAKAKLVTSELAVSAADLGVQMHGGAGYMDEYPISRQYTDARITTIYAGSSEVMKIIISRDCLGENYVPFNTRNF